jgi:PIN domain nuclease of toxin-antitoxin system
VGVVARSHDVQEPIEETVILLDTNALVWLQGRHRRAKALTRARGPFYISPASVLEIQILNESGRLRARGGASVRDLLADDRWTQDDPPSADWFETARSVAWTHDAFDRLIVAHAKLRRWRLATADVSILEHLAPGEYLEL